MDSESKIVLSPKTISLSDIIVPNWFKVSTPSGKKMEWVRTYFNKHGVIDCNLVITKNNVLVDGYIRYLVLLENGVKEAPYIIGKERPPETVTLISAKFSNSEKDYTWRIPYKKAAELDIHIGDTVIVETEYYGKRRTKKVVVDKIYESEDYNDLKRKRVLKKVNKD